MPEVLYRKYRPQTFKEVAGQTHIRITLQHQLELDRLGHAYLFCGPRGVAKTTLARILSRAVNCPNRAQGTAEPCNACQVCKDILSGRSFDVIEIDAASHTGVDHVRENIIDNSRFVPSQLRYKVFIIDEVHMLSVSAFNALLKILEEPPAYVLFVLVTTEVHKIPATIISRCQRFDFKKISLSDTISSLRQVVLREGREVDDTVFDNIARHADGCLRDALSLLDQVLSFGEHRVSMNQVELILPPSHFQTVFEISRALLTFDTRGALTSIQTLVDNGGEVLYFFDELIDFFRKLLIAKVTNRTDTLVNEMNEDQLQKMNQLLLSKEVKFLSDCLEILLQKRQMVKMSVLPQLPLEMAVVAMSFRTISSVIIADQSPVQPLVKVNPIVVSQEKPVIIAQEMVGETSNLNLQMILSRWNSLVQNMSEEFHSLSLLLRVGRPLKFENSILTIGFQFKLHEQRVNQMLNRTIVCKKLRELFGQNIDIVCEVSDKAKIDILPIEEMVTAEIGNQESIDDPQLASILKEFGGKLVS